MNDALISEIASFTLSARTRLEQEADEQLQGLYGWLSDGSFVEAARRPAIQSLPEAAETRRRLEQFAADEDAAGLTASEARKKLLRETAFTWLNRLVGFRLLEDRKLIKQTTSKLGDSNAFKFWLVEDANAAAYAEYQKGDMPKNAMDEGPSQTAYRQFLLAQCASLAGEVSILFDPTSLPSRLCPRPGVLKELVDSIDAKEVADAWKPGNEETLGWIYQFFVEERKKEVFAGFSKGKRVTPEDIGAATQLFTPRWIVRALVENSIGRYWLDMHPDSAFATRLEYLIPLPNDRPAVPLKPAREITFLDPACGTMHFGLVAFDLFVEMYREEQANAGKKGWPSKPSASSDEEIASLIVAENLHGIDIDLRAVQIAVLVLLLRAKSLHKHCTVTDRNVAAANVESITGGRLEELINATKFGNRSEERVLRAVASKVTETPTLGALLRLEYDLNTLVDAERKKLLTSSQPELVLAGLTDDLFTSTRDLNSFFDQLAESIAQRLDAFARDAGSASSHTAGEASKGFRFLRLIQQRYDIVAGNPPYMSTRNQSEVMRAYFKQTYPSSKTDLYAVFIERANEFVAPYGRLAFITQQSFMFISSYEDLRESLRDSVAVETMIHVGPRAFASIGGEKVNTTLFVLRKEPDKKARDGNEGVYFRLVRERSAEAKQSSFEAALAAVRLDKSHPQVFVCRQGEFDTIPDKPWVYWATPGIRASFARLPNVGSLCSPVAGLRTSDNTRFLRFWWEVGRAKIDDSCRSRKDASRSTRRWFPYMKGGRLQRWYGNQDYVIDWWHDGAQVAQAILEAYPYLGRTWLGGHQFYFKEGVTWSDLSSSRFAARHSPGGFVFDVKGSSAFPSEVELLLGILNSGLAHALLNMLNPTISYQVGDVERLPVPQGNAEQVEAKVGEALKIAKSIVAMGEASSNFRTPMSSAEDADQIKIRLGKIEDDIDMEVSKLYGLNDEDWAVIRHELDDSSSMTSDANSDDGSREADEDEDDISGSNLSERTLAQAWISYALGTVLGRYAIGEPGGLGQGEFDAQTVTTVRTLIDADGVMVTEKGHPQDIVRRTVQCLEAMRGVEVARALIRAASDENSGDPEELLRSWLNRFTGQPAASFWKYHQQLYRKRPIFWPFQSPKKHFTAWVFQERFGPTMLFTIKQLADDQCRLIEREITSLRPQSATSKAIAKKVDQLLEATGDIREFSTRLQTIANASYTFCIDDGVLLNAAPLHPLLPSWPETKKAWQELEAGKYDWAQQAMKLWPDRVKEACKTNKSFAIAHGLA
jgi:hypothetical protein